MNFRHKFRHLPVENSKPRSMPAKTAPKRLYGLETWKEISLVLLRNLANG